MKINMGNRLEPRRGDPVKVGNVYANTHGRPFYRIVIAVVGREGGRPWNNVVCIHVNSITGVMGSSNVPEKYLSEHNDLIGYVKDMPELKIEFIRVHPQADRLSRAEKRMAK